MNGFNWNGNDRRDTFDDYMDYKVSGSDNGDGNGHQYSRESGIGCGWVVIIIVVIMLIYFLFNGASFEAIDTLLGLGLLAFLFAKSLFR